jgi:hypothetical protein
MPDQPASVGWQKRSKNAVIEAVALREPVSARGSFGQHGRHNFLGGTDRSCRYGVAEERGTPDGSIIDHRGLDRIAEFPE